MKISLTSILGDSNTSLQLSEALLFSCLQNRKQLMFHNKPINNQLLGGLTLKTPTPELPC